MAIEVDYKVTSNLRELMADFPGGLEKGLTAIGLAAETNAKKLCPVDTGRLRNSITNAVKVDEKAVYIGTNVEYAPYVELGTSRMRARPYLRPAITDYTDEYRALMEDALKNG